MAGAISYEEQRRRQVEENKRKLDELRLHHLSAAVREAAAKPKPTKSLKRKARPPRDAPLRRSGRIANLPEQPNYRDVDVKQKDLPDHVYAVTKAEELQDELGSDYPTFVRPMTLTSLYIPLQFSREHLPERDATIVLVDEEDDVFDTLYRPHSSSLNTGWKQFTVDHELVDGDCLVFQLIKRAMFKVYIIRASSYYENDNE